MKGTLLKYFTYQGQCKENNYGIIDDDDVYEVIGNIYENLELLEKEAQTEHVDKTRG